MGAYDRQIATAKRLIASKGQSVTWISKVSPVIVDPTKPWVKTNGADIEYPNIKMVFLPIYRDSKENQVLPEGSNTIMGAEKAWMAQVPFTPKIEDIVLRGTERLVLKNMDVLRPNGEPILYEIEFEK